MSLRSQVGSDIIKEIFIEPNLLSVSFLILKDFWVIVGSFCECPASS